MKLNCSIENNEAIIDTEKNQIENAKKLTSSSDELEDYEALKAFLIERCQDDYDYETLYLSQVIDQAMNEGLISGVSKREAYRRIMVRLRDNETPMKKKPPREPEADWSKEVSDSVIDEPFNEQ